MELPPLEEQDAVLIDAPRDFCKEYSDKVSALEALVAVRTMYSGVNAFAKDIPGYKGPKTYHIATDGYVFDRIAVGDRCWYELIERDMPVRLGLDLDLYQVRRLALVYQQVLLHTMSSCRRLRMRTL